jgi:signal transduction histidine kinase
MSRLVNDLLDVARVHQGKLELHRRRVDLAAVVGEAVEATRFLFEQKGQALEVALPAGCFFADADPMRLEQVVANLLTNAAKFTPTGGHVRVAAESAPGAVLLRVRDDGLGMAPDLLSRIFELHVQERIGCHGGLGIGLNLVRGLVALHGGTVAATSPGPGQGSEFVVRLPAPPADSSRTECPLPPGDERLAARQNN